ncbi:unnamed protein product [Somion occarium]|uniref:dual-specificity kinase n=1 Tax=Somion occarium TaxID=3059160 RepID=A0ABP1D7Q9_9APHY
MSAPPSPRIGPSSIDKSRSKRRERPPALEFPDPKAASDGDVRYDRNRVLDTLQPRLHVSHAEEPATINRDQLTATDHEQPRSPSATSSLDPYYFGMSTPPESPVPPLPTNALLPKTPDMSTLHDPVTPGKDPASIDRRGLVGVGELATPRWTRSERQHHHEVDVDERVDEVEEEDDSVQVPASGEYEKDMPDSPWTIEAIDGEDDEEIEDLDVPLVPPSLRNRHSMASESGGEEILYPRHPKLVDSPASEAAQFATPERKPIKLAESASISSEVVGSPPTSFVSPTHRARKRTSEEFEMDNTGSVLPKSVTGTTNTPKEKDKTAVRRHRSLGVGIPSATTPRDKAKERRRDTLSVNVKHTRQTSASSSSSNHGENLHSRRVHTADFSHLPPSPSSSSIQQFLRHRDSNGNNASALHTSPRDSQQPQAASVAHSLLRGTQEGWSDLDDQATAEALRKLDGLTGRSARARSSIGGHSRVGSSSRPGTPVKNSTTREAIVSTPDSTQNRRASRRISAHASLVGKEKGKDFPSVSQKYAGLGIAEDQIDGEQATASVTASASGETHSSSSPSFEKTTKKTGSASARSSFTPKRSSGGSTTYTSTPTTSSRDSASLSNATSVTSVSAQSHRQSLSKNRRNSAGSDISSISTDAANIRDRAAAIASTDATEDNIVPPVPPLPKDISSYKPPSTAGSVQLTVTEPSEDKENEKQKDSDREQKPRENTSRDRVVPTLEPVAFPHTPSKQRSLSVHQPSTPTSSTTPHKTPSKKWSFSNALGKLSKSPSISSMNVDAASPRSSRALSFGQSLRKSSSKDQPLSPVVPTASKRSSEDWSPINVDAMASASSLASMSSIGSVKGPISPPASAPPPITTSKTPERFVPSRSETASSASTNLTASAPIYSQPLSPASSVRRGPSTKRLTPSSIPFFRRSSSQSMQHPPNSANSSSLSPTNLAGPNQHSHGTHLRAYPSRSPPKDVGNVSSSSVSVPGSVQKNSRRSLHSDKEKSDAKHGRDPLSRDKDKSKKDERDRSESRISVLMGRKRGKTVSSAQPKKPAEPVALPPMQISALPPVTAQRVASLKSGSSSSLSSNQSMPKASSSRVTAQTVSSMQKQSDSSLRSRHQLPTIAGSPSVGSISHGSMREPKDAPPSSSLNVSSALSKETPTKIPRISSRSSATNSPTLKSNRRTSTLIGSSSGIPTSRDASPAATNEPMNEFGVLENGTGAAASKAGATSSQRHSVRASPSTTASRVPRQVSNSSSATLNGGVTRKSNRESISFSGLRKSSTGSVASISVNPPPETQTQSSHRFSALSPSKGLKLLSPKMSLPTARGASSSSQSLSQAMASPSSSRQSLSTPSPAPSPIDEEEMLGDEEMMQYIRRQQAKKLANGVSQHELDEMLRFPEPIRPVSPLSPAAIFKSSQAKYLSEYECKEIQEYQSVYYIGANSKKNLATLDNSTNNHGYDDERGDYLVVPHDHLAFRYEVIDTLGKGSFGQVLHCRDHCTGESVAIKIIRNKKRFHHQALVEIKILDSLRKWDQEEKHHVIKMTEHFYFRGHLCIAMELLSINLYELIKANGFVGFTTALIRRFTSQMLQSLALMRHHRIVHCDLKPENVLLRHPAKSAIKVIDFGSSCFEHEKIYTYIQSRFYRSPEVILGMNYHMAIDMWSLGCILAELYTGFPIFPGENEQEQLSCIMEVLGVPDKEFINRSSRKRLFFDTTGAPRPVVNSKGRRRRPGTKSLAQVLRCDDELFLDFISKCLVWDPERRMKPQAALRHPFVTSGKKPAKVSSPTPSSTAKSLLQSTTSSFTSSRSSKQILETPKKSLISAPTPLTARTTRLGTGAIPTTPSTSNTAHISLGSGSRSYRSSQAQPASYHSSRSLAAK